MKKVCQLCKSGFRLTSITSKVFKSASTASSVIKKKHLAGNFISVALVSALVPLFKSSPHFDTIQWKCPLQNENDLALLEISFPGLMRQLHEVGSSLYQCSIVCRPDTSRRQQRQMPLYPLFIALVPLTFPIEVYNFLI